MDKASQYAIVLQYKLISFTQLTVTSQQLLFNKFLDRNK